MILDEIRDAVRAHRESGKGLTRGRAIFELNVWKGEERRKLDEEYDRRLAEINARPEGVQDQYPPEVLAMVAEAVAMGQSRSNLRVALGKPNLRETDEVIALARGHVREQVATGEGNAYTLRPTGRAHTRGWPMYAVTLHESGETFQEVYLVTTGSLPASRKSLRITPALPGSQELLDLLDELGVTDEMYERGQTPNHPNGSHHG